MKPASNQFLQAKTKIYIQKSMWQNNHPGTAQLCCSIPDFIRSKLPVTCLNDDQPGVFFRRL